MLTAAKQSPIMIVNKMFNNSTNDFKIIFIKSVDYTHDYRSIKNTKTMFNDISYTFYFGGLISTDWVNKRTSHGKYCIIHSLYGIQVLVHWQKDMIAILPYLPYKITVQYTGCNR